MKIDTQTLREEAVSQLEQLLLESERKLTQCWQEIEEAAAQRDKVPKMKLTFGISVDGETMEVHYDLTFGLRYKVEADGSLAQLNLPLADQN